MRPVVVITEHLDEVCARWLSERAEVRWCSYQDVVAFAEGLGAANGLIVRTYTRVDEKLLEAAPGLKVVGRAGVGLDNINLDACRSRGVRVVHTPEANTDAVVQYVFSLILDAFRPRQSFEAYIGSEAFAEQRARLVGRQVDGLTLGVLGFGRIGQRVGRVGHAMGMRVLANDLLPAGHFDGLDTTGYPFEWVEKDELYEQSDVLTLHVDGRAENGGLIGREVLSQLRPNCLLINTARGLLVDPEALSGWARAVLDSGGGAVLDVHEPEPPGGGYPLYGLQNVRLLPHLASRTLEAMEAMSWVVRDVSAVLSGEQPRHLVC